MWMGSNANAFRSKCRPARLSYGTATAPGLCVNRRSLGGPVDEEVIFLTVEDEGGEITGVLFAFSLHGVIMGHPNLRISADYIGAARRVVEQALPGAVVTGDAGWLVLAFPLLIGGAALLARFVLLPLIRTFDVIKEYIFLLTIGWCLGVAEAAAVLGLSHEIGAFVGGITMAASPVSIYIADSLRPLRDFFLVLFFFSLGAGFELEMLGDVLFPAAVLAGLMLLIKGPVFSQLLRRTGEAPARSQEVGARLAQLSEFSLLLAVLAQERGQIGDRASYLIQLATLLTFLVSTYAVVLRYPTPIALSDRLRRD